jgi:hypothetical protein
MNTSTSGFPQKNRRGSVILVVMIAIIVLSIIGINAMDVARSSQGLSMRNTRILAAQSVAESELELLFYHWQTRLKQGSTTTEVSDHLSADNLVDVATSSATLFDDAATTRQPFGLPHRAAGWTVRRAFCFSGENLGQLPDDPRKTSIIARFSAGVIVTGRGPNAGIEIRLGRRFAMSDTSIFQFAIFYQGDLELAPGTDMNILGPIAANGDIYAGANQWKVLKFFDTVSFGGKFNGDLNGFTDSQKRHPLSPAPLDKNGTAKWLRAPVFASDADDKVARTKQLKRMADGSKENFIGGLDAKEIASSRPDLFGGENDVYRSVIEPPPAKTLTPEGKTVDTDDPVIASRRLHNRAGLRITVTALGEVAITDGNGADYTGVISPADLVPLSSRRQTVYDQREQKNVKVTTLDVAKLISTIKSNDDLAASFNGVVYVTDQQTPDGVIRLVNGATLPASGLTVATNNALYVQGDYNTTQHSGKTASASLVADTVTVLSSNWRDSNSAGAISNRKASSDITVVAGILTGNTPTKAGSNSGGAHNLVRLMEDWSGRTITFKGSIGQLFQSKYFTSAFPTTLGTVYSLPNLRVMEFDSAIASSPPPGSPTSTQFTRGDFFAAYN